MKRFVFSLFLSTLFLASFAQIYNFNLPELMIDNFDSSDFSFGAVDSNNANTFLNTMAGDTIIFKGNMVRDDFYKLDTIWLKSNVKKPVLGKHYIVNYHYKTLDNDKTTPNEFVYDRPWVILKSSIEGDGNLEMSKKNYLDLKDVETGDIVRWKYREGYRFSENVEIIDLTKSKAFHDILKKLVLFEQSGNEIFPSPEFTEISIMNVTAKIVTRDKGNSLDLLTTILLSDNVTYYFAKKKLQHTIILVNENVKNQRLNELKNKGRFFLTLTNVEKPKNSKILKGKIITLPNDNILKTKYSYEDNIMIIVFDEGIEKMNFL